VTPAPIVGRVSGGSGTTRSRPATPSTLTKSYAGSATVTSTAAPAGTSAKRATPVASVVARATPPLVRTSTRAFAIAAPEAWFCATTRSSPGWSAPRFTRRTGVEVTRSVPVSTAAVICVVPARAPPVARPPASIAATVVAVLVHSKRTPGTTSPDAASAIATKR
jgi:hypothetical protein